MSQPPDFLDAPPLAGETLIGWGNQRDSNARPKDVTWQPSGYDVFQPDDRTVSVALRCIGEGTVEVSAGEVFRFSCTDTEQTLVRLADGPQRRPFMIGAKTTGQVVWAARVGLRGP